MREDEGCLDDAECNDLRGIEGEKGGGQLSQFVAFMAWSVGKVGRCADLKRCCRLHRRDQNESDHQPTR